MKQKIESVMYVFAVMQGIMNEPLFSWNVQISQGRAWTDFLEGGVLCQLSAIRLWVVM